MSGSGTFGNVLVRFTTVADPPPKDNRGIDGGIWDAIGDDRIHRYVIDPIAKRCFGFDLIAMPDGPNRFRVTFEPLSLRPEQIGYGPEMLMLQPKFPPPQVLENGDTIVIDLLVRPDGRGKIVEYIQVLSKQSPPAPRALGEPRDITLDDAPLRFSFESPTKLLKNGQAFDLYGMTGRPGATLWFDIPGRGRYILSLTPRDGFRKAGVIGDNAIVFEDGGDRYELRTSSPILGSARAWNLYLLHDASYPVGANPHYGTDRLENLLRPPSPPKGAASGPKRRPLSPR